jgi:hypothetical protein
MFNPSFDRTEWRSRYTHELIAAAKESGHELAIALGERLDDLEDADDQLRDVIAERDDLDRQVTRLLTELNELHDALKGAGTEAD